MQDPSRVEAAGQGGSPAWMEGPGQGPVAQPVPVSSPAAVLDPLEIVTDNKSRGDAAGQTSADFDLEVTPHARTAPYPLLLGWGGPAVCNQMYSAEDKLVRVYPSQDWICNLARIGSC